MPAVDSKTIDTDDQVIIPASHGHSKAAVQWISGEEVFLAFGVPSEDNKGITLGTSTGILIYEVPKEFVKIGVHAKTATATAEVQYALV